MKKLLLSFMMVLLLAPSALKAQEFIGKIVGTVDAETNAYPCYFYRNASWTEAIYTADEIALEGDNIYIHSISYKCVTATESTSPPTKTSEIKVYVAQGKYEKNYHGSKKDWKVTAGNNTLVYQNTSYTWGDDEWETFDFIEPLKYDVTNGIAIAVSKYCSSTTSSIYNAAQTITGSSLAMLARTANNAYPYTEFPNNTTQANSTNSKRPIIKITYSDGLSASGDNVEEAIIVSEIPYEDTKDVNALDNDYDLPGETPDGPDAVYKLELKENAKIKAYVTGTNGKIAIYTQSAAESLEGPGADNYYGATAPTKFFYDFEDSDLSDFTLVDADGDGNEFSIVENAYTESHTIISYSYNPYDYIDYQPDNYIYTTNKYHITEQSQLKYTVAAPGSGSVSTPDKYSVVISLDGKNFSPVITEIYAGQAKDVTYKFIGSEFVGKDVHIGFRHHDCEGDYYVEFDDFELTDGSSKSSRATATDNSIEGLVLEAGIYYIIASATEGDFIVNIDDNYVAQVNGVKYESMQEAVNAASEDLITLLKNVEGPAFDVKKTVTINLNGKTYTINNESPIKLSEGTLTLQNGTIAGKGEYTNLINITGDAQLVHDADISGTMTKTVAATTEGWGTISSPVGDVACTAVDGLLVAGAELYLYDEANEYWRYFEGEDYSSLEAGRGYLYASSNATNVKFTGTFGVNDVNYTLSCASAGQLKGFNMIGNPFTHDVNVDYFSISTGASYSNQFYVLSDDGGWEVGGTTIFNRNISPMKSLLIKTDKEATFTISNVKNSAKSRGENNGMLQINVSNSQYSDAAYVSFNKGLGLDKISHRNAEIPMVYVPVDGVNYAVAMMDKDVTEVPVSFKAMTMGEYTISAKALDCEFEQMTLVDRLTGESTNLLLEDYTFMARSNDNASRFVIYLTGKDNADVDSEIFVFHNNDELVINNISGNAVVRIIDIMGRSVAEYNVSGSANISTSSFANGVYMIQMSDENGVKVQKVVID